ncbi:MAG: glucose 1-dehydrogenase [Alphaproteobacteria bacterium]
MRLKNKVALITGAASGFGEGMARRFAEEGASIIVADLNEAGAKAVADSIATKGGKAQAIKTDVTKSADVKAAVDRALAAYGRLDIMVNNAGVPQIYGPMAETNEAQYDRLFAVNVKSIYWSAIHAVPALKRGGGGVIINTVSNAAARPRPGLTWYNGTKGAVATITRSMAVELAPDKIRVNGINPTAADTPMLTEEFGPITPELRARFLAGIPLGRLCEPIDIANAALYLASDEGQFLTGVLLDVDGGRAI